MNEKRARSIRRFFGENKTAARRVRRDIARHLTAAAQQPKNLGAGPAVPVGRAGNGKPDAMAPHASPLRAIFQIARGDAKVARHLIANAVFPGNCGRDPIKFLANGPRTRVNAVLRQLQAA